jgi:hypothetical protein
MKMTRAMAVALAVVMLASVARADPSAGDACAANLTTDGKAIYAAVVAANPTSQTLREVVEAQTRSLVLGGQISRDTARDNAIAAGECVRTRVN